MYSFQILGEKEHGEFEFNFYNCKEKKKVLCEVPTDMEKKQGKSKTGKKKRPRKTG